MERKIGKKLKNILYSIPIAVASFLPMNKANGQIINKNAFDRWDATEQTKIEKPNTIYIGIQPIDLSASIGYGRKITSKFETYLFLSKGKYMSPFNPYIDNSKDSYVDHYKIALGGMIHTPKDYNGLSAFISFGPSFSICNKEHYEPGTINEKAFKKLSLEGGAGVTFPRRFGIGFSFDWMKGESNVYIKKSF